MPLSGVIFPACAGVLREANYNDPIPRVSGGVPGKAKNNNANHSFSPLLRGFFLERGENRHEFAD